MGWGEEEMGGTGREAPSFSYAKWISSRDLGYDTGITVNGTTVNLKFCWEGRSYVKCSYIL